MRHLFGIAGCKLDFLFIKCFLRGCDTTINQTSVLVQSYTQDSDLSKYLKH